MKLKLIAYCMFAMLFVDLACKKPKDAESAAESAQLTSPTVISFVVKDQSTDFAVPEALITVRAPDGTTSTLKAPDGKLSFTANRGRYSFSIQSNGYKNLETYFESGENSAIAANINLDPIVVAKTLSIAPPNTVVIRGYVKDADKYAPLAGVEVSAGGYIGVTDSRGFFSVQFAVPAHTLKEGEMPKSIAVKFSKPGYAGYTVHDFYLFPETTTMKVSLSALGSQSPGKSQNQSEVKAPQQQQSVPQVESVEHGLFDRTAADDQQRYIDYPKTSFKVKTNPGIVSAVAVPTSIRVGTSCSCTTCSSVQVMSLEAYVQSGLDNEWISGWGAASLQAGAVAYRSYGAYYVLHPVKSNFDIAASTCNQAWGSAIVASTQNAAIATAGSVLVKNNAIFRSEYSAENNNSGCGNGYSGTGSAWPCISDSRCAGRTKNGHGRGMCQWGSSFWASDKTYTWILDHYYTPGGVSVQFGGTPPPPTTGTFDDFSSGVGRYTRQPTYSGSTVGIATTSTASHYVSGTSTHLKVTLNDNTSITTNWFVRLLSGDGIAANNVQTANGGKLYYWLKTANAQTGATARIWVDDSDGTEQSAPITIINDNAWHKYEWTLSGTGWTAVAGGNSAITGANVTLDAIILSQPNTATQWVSYIDDVGN